MSASQIAVAASQAKQAVAPVDAVARVGNTGTQYNAPAAAANAQKESDAAHAVIVSHLTAAQQAATDPGTKAMLTEALKTASLSRQTIDPVTGQVTASMDSGAPVSFYEDTQANQKAGLQTTATSTTPVGSPITPETGSTFSATGSSDAQQSAIESLRNRGMADAQIRTIINDPAALSKALAAPNTGTGTGGSSTANYQAVVAKYDALTKSGQSIDPAQKAKDLAAAQVADKAASDQQNATNTAQGDKSALDSAAGTSAGGMGVPPATGDPTIDALNAEKTQNIADATAVRDAELNGGTIDGQKITGVNDTFAKSDADLADLKKAANDKAVADKAAADQALKDQEDLANLQKQQAEYDRTVQEQQDLMKNADDQKKAVDDEVASLCLTGQAGSGVGMLEIAQVDQKFQNNYLDIIEKFQHDMGPGGEIAVKYAAAYTKASDDYKTAMSTSTKDLIASLTTIEGQQRTTDQARETATRGIMDKFVSDIAGIRKDYSTAIEAHAKSISDEAYRKEVHDDSVQARKDAVDARNQAHADAMMQHNDAKSQAESDKWYQNGQKAATAIINDIGNKTKSPNIGTYDDFSVLYNKWQVIAKDGKLDTTNQSTSVLLQDLFANANNPKLTARMPAQTVQLLHDNLSVWEKAAGLGQQFFNGGTIPTNVLKDMNTAMNDLHDSAKENAQEEMDGYIIRSIHENSLIPEGYRHFGIDSSDLNHADLTVEGPDHSGLGNADESSAPPSDSDIMNGTDQKTSKVDTSTIQKTLSDAGFTGDALKTATAIAMAESGGDPNAVGDTSIQDDTWGPSVGLMQIRSLKDASKDPYRDASKLKDLAYNAKAAFIKSNGGKDFSPWSTFNNGSYKKYIPQVS